MDTLTPRQRSERMARIRSKNTKPELRVRQLLHQIGYRYRIHVSSLPGCPDLVFPSRKKVIFVHGCFWHGHAGCKVANRPKTRTSFWLEKFARNRARDVANRRRLKRLGWVSYTIWECESRNPEQYLAGVTKFLGRPNTN